MPDAKPNGFGTIIIDPPWPYQRTSAVGKAGALTGYSDQHYEPLSINDLAELPIEQLADGVVLLWATGAMMDVAVDLIRAWGLNYKTMMFWHKATSQPQRTFTGETVYKAAFGVGYWFRGDTEPIVVATAKGSPSHRTGERATFIHQRLKHSRKPDYLHQLAEKHFPGPYLEVFARRPYPGWTCLGDAIDGRDIRESLGELTST